MAAAAVVPPVAPGRASFGNPGLMTPGRAGNPSASLRPGTARSGSLSHVAKAGNGLSSPRMATPDAASARALPAEWDASETKLVYAEGATLIVSSPAVPFLSSGDLCSPSQHPIGRCHQPVSAHMVNRFHKVAYQQHVLVNMYGLCWQYLDPKLHTCAFYRCSLDRECRRGKSGCFWEQCCVRGCLLEQREQQQQPA